jgi:hypothetical protein
MMPGNFFFVPSGIDKSPLFSLHLWGIGDQTTLSFGAGYQLSDN